MLHDTGGGGGGGGGGDHILVPISPSLLAFESLKTTYRSLSEHTVTFGTVEREKLEERPLVLYCQVW